MSYIKFLILSVQMKVIFVVFAIAAIVATAGCVGQSGIQTKPQEPQTGKTYEFATLKEAYDSGLELKCEVRTGTEQVRITYYIVDGNIRIDSSGPGRNAYQILTKTNEYHGWSDIAEGVATTSGSSTEQARQQLFSTPFKVVECFEQSISSSMFEPPKK